MSQDLLTLSVFELTQAIKFHLEKQFFNVSVQGEISNFKKQSSGHLYFTLKDAQAQIQCVMFALDARTLKTLPRAGDQVTLSGEINVYPPRGNYQIIVRKLVASGIGALLMLLEERKHKYHQLGYFDPMIKKALPKNPRRIGIVSSPTGAVIQDILQILNRRAHGYHILLNPVKVQGEGSREEVAKAIDEFNRYNLVDLIIVARGGGSVEDLWAFNEECVVESVHKSQIPIISAVGHETDVTLCDLAADVRAPTPSAAAELAIEDAGIKWSFLEKAIEQINQFLRSQLLVKKQHLSALSHHPYLLRPERVLEGYAQRVDEKISQLETCIQSKLQESKSALYDKKLELSAQNPILKIEKAKGRLAEYQEKMTYLLNSFVQIKKSKLTEVGSTLMAINPKKLLEKGYSILFDEKKNSAIVSVNDLQMHQTVKVLLSDGNADAEIKKIALEKP